MNMILLVRALGIVLAGLFASSIFLADCAKAQPGILGQSDGCSEIVGLLQGGAGRTPLNSDVVRIDWKRNSDCLVRFLGAFKSPRQIMETDYLRLTSATGALRAIIENNGREAISYMRSIDTSEALNILAYSARSGDKGLRLNSTFVIANIIDNDSACIVVDHLFDPALAATEEGRNGRANLLGTLRAIANWADPFVRIIVRDVIVFTDSSIANKSDVVDTKRLLTDLDERLRNPIASAPRTSAGCRNYAAIYGANAFALAREQYNWEMTRAEGSPGARKAALQSITSAFCYQEENSEKDPNDRYLVLCHRTEAQCSKTRGPNTRASVRQSKCERTQFVEGASMLTGDGHEGALYHYNTTMHGEPFPAVPVRP